MFLAVFCGQVAAHEGHDHGDAPPDGAVAAPRASSSSDRLELVAIARAGSLLIYLDRFGTNEPVTGATILAEGPDGKARAEPQPDGSYRLPARWSLTSGHHDLLLTVSDSGETDLFPLQLDIPEPAPAPAVASLGDAPAFARGLAGRLGGFGLAAAGAGAGFLAGILVTLLIHRPRRRLATAAMLAVAAAVAVAPEARSDEGHAHGPAGEAAAPVSGPSASGARDQARRGPDGAVFVPKPTQRILAIRTVVSEVATHRRAIELPGRVVPDPNGSGLVQTSVGGRLSPPPGGFPRLGTAVRKGDVLAYVNPPIQAIDASDMRQRQGELDQQIAIVERRLSRLEPLARSGAVAQAQLDEARLEIAGLRDRRAALDTSRREPEALIAPVDGVIAEANAVAGQMAQPTGMVFHIVDPDRLWIEALSFESLPGAPDASARLPSGQVLRLRFQGAGLADRNQAVPVHFSVEGGAGGLRIGQFVTVVASQSTERAGLALPRTSVVRSAGGQDLVYEHTGAERFEPREIRLQALDADRVYVASGLAAGRRVVTSGAELLNQVR
ncbi:efflux RND transporter periplasmic adaptor subunit [Enterovirga sp.]|uniref:efflux RND transporter periplasmic adaptor subunit n=1 Tax=Enterovirga sp. TaxID=2026350 RepID=UPI002623095A|nr:efflux RND transporter periplasmic adaptor subunit [Enterovirga sp.]